MVVLEEGASVLSWGYFDFESVFNNLAVAGGDKYLEVGVADLRILMDQTDPFEAAVDLLEDNCLTEEQCLDLGDWFGNTQGDSEGIAGA